MGWFVAFIALFLALVVYLIQYSGDAGEDRAKLKDLEDSQDDIRTAKLARERIDSDPNYLARVREKFTRK